MLATSAESATPEIRRAKPVLSSSPLAGQKASDTGPPSTAGSSRPTPGSPSSAASPALRGDLGITSEDIQKVLDAEPFGVVFETSTTVNGEPRLMGKTKDGLAIVELIGPPTGLTMVDCLVGQPSDSPRAAIQNAGIFLALLKKTLPAWDGSANWLNTALAASNRDGRETGDIETTFRRVHVRLHYFKPLGMITLSISSPSATPRPLPQ
jgi:hypothetical protein